MRTGKRWLAGVAAGALAVSFVPVAVVATATSAQAEVTGSVTPVRVSFAGTSLESVPYSNITWSTAGYAAAAANNDTVSVRLLAAPSPTAIVGFAEYAAADAGQATVDDAATPTTFQNSATATVVTGIANVTLQTGLDQGTTFNTTGDANTPGIGVAATQSGSYAGQIYVYDNAGAVLKETVDFSFTTRGKATSLTLTPATQSIAQGGVTAVVAELKDAGGNRTQPLWVDSLGLTVTGGTTVPTVANGVTSSNLSTGTDTIAYTQAPAAAGVYSVTATPLGTLATGGATAQTATITAIGSVSTTAITNMSVSVPADASTSGTFAGANRTSAVPTGTSSVTVSVTGGAGNAGQTLRFALVPPASGTVNGSTSTQYVQVAADATGAASFSFTIGGAGLLATASTQVNQVNAANVQITTGGQNVRLLVTQANAAVSADTITVDPSGAVTTALGTSVPVSVLVQDQFGGNLSNIQVTALRGATVGAGTVVSTGVTNASGIASLTLSGATGIVAGTTEQYSFSIAGPGAATELDNQTQVQYTTSGAVTAMTVTVVSGATATNPITNLTTSIANIPQINVPFTGDVETVSTDVYAVATGITTAGVSGNYAQFRPTPTPGNPVTVTVPEGLKVVTATGFAAGEEWNGGALSATIASGSNVYIFGTKAGIHDVTFTSGDITATAKVRVVSPVAASYNVAISPETQSIAEGGFGTVTASVTDVFGNPVGNAAADANYGVTLSISGPALLAGQTQSLTVTMGASGSASVAVLASGGSTGEATITVAPSAAAVLFANGAPTTRAWSSAGYVPPTSAPAPVKSGEAKATITQKDDRSLSIIGERTTVGGKPGIRVEGAAVDFANGDKVKPWIRFPGQTEYSAGSARPVVSEEEFTWQRKTGKKIYVYFTNEDEAIKSNRVIIPAK